MDTRTGVWTPESDDGPDAAGWLSASAAAAVLGVSQRTVRRAIASGLLPASKVGGVYRIAPSDLSRYQAVRGWAAASTRTARRTLPPLLPFPAQERDAAPLAGRLRPELIGRELERAELRALLLREDVPLVTLTGPGGVGKTRLALEVAADLRTAFADGVYFVGLATLADASLVLEAIAAALGMREGGDLPLVQRLTEYLKGRAALLVLDNFEGVVAAAPAVTLLLANCHGVKVLATSRIPLNLTDELRYPVPPLALPDPERARTFDQIAHTAAVRLFCARARAVQPGFELTDENANVVASICGRLDGLPLAIELAAARSGVLTPSALLARLDRGLTLLAGGPRDQPTRLRTMWNAIAWSHDLLNPHERVLFRRLSVFVGGCTLEAAEFVGGTAVTVLASAHERGSAPSVLDVLSSLVEHSMLRGVGRGEGEARFGMLETIREFGLVQLGENDEEVAARNAHAAWCLGLATEASPAWFSPAQKAWGDRLQAEHGNLRAALSWIAAAGDVKTGLNLISALWPFWFIRGHWAEGREWLGRALTWSAGDRTRERAWALIGASAVAVDQRDPAVESWGKESHQIAIELGDTFVGAHALISRGVSAAARGDAEQAIHLNQAAFAAFLALGDTIASATPTASLMLDNLAFVALGQGDDERALNLAEQALALQRRADYPWGMADSFLVMARVARKRGDAAQAVALARESLDFAWNQPEPQQIVWALDLLAILAIEEGNAGRAALLFAATERLQELLSGPTEPGKHADRDRALEAVRGRLGLEKFAAACAAGKALTLEETIAEAMLVEAVLPGSGPSGAADRHGLTPRELEVLRLVAAGQTDREIGDALFVSTRTVNTHVARVLAKLDVPTRRSATARARALQLLPMADGVAEHT